MAPAGDGDVPGQRGLFEPGPSLLEEKGPDPLPGTELGRWEGDRAGAPGLWWPLG